MGGRVHQHQGAQDARLGERQGYQEFLQGQGDVANGVGGEFGSLFFSQGVLQKWNNDSGHYKPHTSLHLQVRNLLPVDKYEAR